MLQLVQTKLRLSIDCSNLCELQLAELSMSITAGDTANLHSNLGTMIDD